MLRARFWLKHAVSVLKLMRFTSDSHASTLAYQISCASPVQMDLGSLAHVSRIRRWLYYGDGRSYCNQAVVLSATGDFAGEEETVWQCSDYEDCGPEKTEEAGFEGNLTGKVIRFPSRPARYIRYYAGRSNVNAATHFIEVQVFGTWDMESSTQMVDPTRSGAEVYASGWTLRSENQKYQLELLANGDLVVRDRDTKAPAIWKLGSPGENCNAVCLSLGSSYHCDRETTATGASSHADFLSILTQVAPVNVSDPVQQDGGAGGPGWISGVNGAQKFLALCVNFSSLMPLATHR